MSNGAGRSIAVGAFVIGGLLLFSIGIFLIGNRRMLFREHFEVRAQFARIAGLQVGAKVRVAGMDAGEVTLIHVPVGPSAKFLVIMRVRSDLHPVVRTDSVASIQNEGLVGNKFVQIEAGTDNAPQVADGGNIQSSEPFDFADLMQRMSDTIDSVNQTIADVQTQLNITLGAVTETAQTTEALVDDVSADVREIADSGRRLTESLTTIVTDVQSGRGTLGRLFTDDALYRQAVQISEQAQQTVANLRDATEQAKQAINGLRGEGGPIKGLSEDLAQTLNHTRDAMADLAENAEALKHNFLFRGFFNRRGYFDLSDVTPQQYRAGALEAGGRVPLRIWLSASVLFTRNRSGTEVLTDEGRLRLDSAMSQFVQYPRNIPLIVEGYATEPSGGERYLISRARAQLVLDYVVSRYGLDAQNVAVMPLGSEAPNSPGGGVWNGVALALWVPREAFATAKPVAQGLIHRR